MCVWEEREWDTHLVKLHEYSIDALFGGFLVFVGDFCLIAQHLVDGIDNVVHLFTRYVAIVVDVVQFECPCHKRDEEKERKREKKENEKEILNRQMKPFFSVKYA